MCHGKFAGAREVFGDTVGQKSSTHSPDQQTEYGNELLDDPCSQTPKHSQVMYRLYVLFLASSVAISCYKIFKHNGHVYYTCSGSVGGRVL